MFSEVFKFIQLTKTKNKQKKTNKSFKNNFEKIMIYVCI